MLVFLILPVVKKMKMEGKKRPRSINIEEIDKEAIQSTEKVNKIYNLERVSVQNGFSDKKNNQKKDFLDTVSSSSS